MLLQDSFANMPSPLPRQISPLRFPSLVSRKMAAFPIEQQGRHLHWPVSGLVRCSLIMARWLAESRFHDPFAAEASDQRVTPLACSACFRLERPYRVKSLPFTGFLCLFTAHCYGWLVEFI